MSIGEKIKMTAEEQDAVRVTMLPNSQADISFKTADAITKTEEFDFSDGELPYMKKRVEEINLQGMFSAETIGTFDRLLEAANGLEPEASLSLPAWIRCFTCAGFGKSFISRRW
jgi:hypothetical protein